jgi:hypothetical protein
MKFEHYKTCMSVTVLLQFTMAKTHIHFCTFNKNLHIKMFINPYFALFTLMVSFNEVLTTPYSRKSACYKMLHKVKELKVSFIC